MSHLIILADEQAACKQALHKDPTGKEVKLSRYLEKLRYKLRDEKKKVKCAPNRWFSEAQGIFRSSLVEIFAFGLWGAHSRAARATHFIFQRRRKRQNQRVQRGRTGAQPRCHPIL